MATWVTTNKASTAIYTKWAYDRGMRLLTMSGVFVEAPRSLWNSFYTSFPGSNQQRLLTVALLMLRTQDIRTDCSKTWWRCPAGPYNNFSYS